MSQQSLEPWEVKKVTASSSKGKMEGLAGGDSLSTNSYSGPSESVDWHVQTR